MNHFGFTRTAVQRDHAFIAPDGHVMAPLLHWQDTSGVTLIAPRMGAGFAMYLAQTTAHSRTAGQAAGAERFVYMLEGSFALATGENENHRLESGSFAYFPPDHPYELHSQGAGRLLVLERLYQHLDGYTSPEPIIGHESSCPAEPFMGDERAQLQELLPRHGAFDMAVNLFTFAPGAALPFVETHVMEHGLLMLRGGGVYRLGDAWYPIQAGDAIWMGPFVPQWFGALGRTPASYLYYKDVNRDPLIP